MLAHRAPHQPDAAMAFDDADLLAPDGEALAPEELERRASAAQEEHRRTERLAASRVFFVRLPKPAELSSSGPLDREKAAIDEKLRKLGDELQPVMAERSQNSSKLALAREAARELKANIDDNQAILNPYREERTAAREDREAQRRTREEQRQADRKAREDVHRAELGAKQRVRNEFASQYGHLGVASDNEVDARLRELEFRQQHESLTIAEEKAVIKQIKQLQDSREAVRAFAQWSADERADREARAALAKRRREEKEAERAAAPAPAAAEAGPPAEGPPEGEGPEAALRREMAEVKRVLDGLWEDYKVQMDIRNRHQEIEAGLRERVEALLAARDALRKERDEVRQRIQAHRDAVRAAHKPFADNRAFSSEVRDLARGGRAGEARERCGRQTEELVARLAGDAAFRAEYNRLWDAAVDHSRPAASVSETHHNAAVSVIAEALEVARRSVASKAGRRERAPDAGRPEARPGGGEPVAAAEAAPAPPRPAPIPGLEAADRPRARPRKERKAAKAAPVELPQLDETPFVPPVATLGKSAGPTPAERKEQERAHNRAAAAEAAQRKERRRLAQERKRVKAQQRSEAALPPPAEAGEAAPEEEVAAPTTPPAEEASFKAGDGGVAPGLPAAVAQDAKLRARSGKVKAAPVPKPRPFRKKTWAGALRQAGRRAYAAVEESPALAAGVGGALVLLAAAVPAAYYLS